MLEVGQSNSILHKNIDTVMTMQVTKTELQIKNPKRYALHVLVQCLGAGVFLLLVLLLADGLLTGLVASSICASTFIAFAYPHAESSKPRYMIGGYATAILCGGLGWVGCTFTTSSELPTHALFCAAAVFATILLMVVCDFQHPPSAALAFTMVGTSHPVTLGLYTFGCILVLCLIKRLFRKFFVNL
jgi:CBS-domain-containing membrane protein